MKAVRRFNGRPRLVLGVAAALAAVTLSACGDDVPELGGGVASFDIAVGDNPRLLVGVSDTEGNILAGGTVKVKLKPIQGSADEIDTTATFVPIPGHPSGALSDKPKLVEPAEQLGVYAVKGVTFPVAGSWEVSVDAGKAGRTTTYVSVEEQHLVPAPGDAAPRSDNLTVDSPGVVPGALDSSVKDGTLADLTDRALHTTTIAAAIDARKPVIVVVATPVYCTSRFCGPTTDAVAAIAAKHPGVAFVHLEVWKDYDTKVVNEAAAFWMNKQGDPTNANEPWVFAVDRDGIITKRWDNVLDLDELNAEIARLEATS